MIPIIIPVIINSSASALGYIIGASLAIPTAATIEELSRNGTIDNISSSLSQLGRAAREQKQKNVDFWIPEGDPRKNG